MAVVLVCQETLIEIHIYDISGGTIFPHFDCSEAVAAAAPAC